MKSVQTGVQNACFKFEHSRKIFVSLCAASVQVFKPDFSVQTDFQYLF